MESQKEAILKKHFRLAEATAYPKVEQYKNIIHAAMDEYAAELRKENERLKESLSQEQTRHCESANELQSANEAKDKQIEIIADQLNAALKDYNEAKKEFEYWKQRFSEGWVKEKPEFVDDCILLTATYLNENEGWLYDLFTVQKTDGVNDDDENIWYWGIFCADGEEWGDIEDLHADLYKIIPQLKNQEATKGKRHSR